MVLNFLGKGTPFEMWEALKILFESSSDVRKMALRDKLKRIQMNKIEIVVHYLSKFTRVRDELGGVGYIVPPSEIVSLSLLSIPKS